MNKFFISTPLGFEESTLQDMKEIWPFLLGKDSQTHTVPFPAVEVLQGGLEFEADLFTGLQFNFFLKTANRVLLRLASFKARDLPKFYQKFKALPWREYLHHSHVEWVVAAQKSRLNNEKRLQDSAETALHEIFASVPEGPEACGAIYIRMDDDLCTVSLDTTGEHLHKRGWSVLKGEAPLRETIAAYMLRELIGETTPAELKEITLLDPMVGSGTLLTEARTLWGGQFQRRFGFQKWKKAPKLFLSESFSLNYRLPASPVFGHYRGFDIHEDMIPVALQNFAEAERQWNQSRRADHLSGDVQIVQQDALEASSAAPLKGLQPLWLISNPPYGERLAEAGGADGLFGLVESFCALYKPARMGLLFPEREPLLVFPEGYKKMKELKVNNGGLRCLFTVLATL